MKLTKKILCIVLSLMMIFSMFAVSSAAAYGSITSFKINAYGNGESSIDSISWHKGNGENYYMFLPADADLNSLTVWYQASIDVYVGDSKLVSGEKTDVFSKTGLYDLTVGNKSYSLYVMRSAEIPSVYISTESGSLDYIHASKDNKEAGAIKIVENGEVTVDKELKQIKGRGNATWKDPKKPYNIKFDKKTDLFGMGKAKKWTLLASYRDPALIRNILALGLADEIGLPYTSEIQPVDLYINGDYMGNYLVCESVEIGSERVDINDLEDANEEANPDIEIEDCSRGGTGIDGSVGSATEPGSMKWVNIPNNPENITGGYLMEFEFPIRYEPEISGFVTNQGQNVVLKSPEYASQAEVEYISSFMCEAEDAIYSEDGYNSLGKHYSEYFDMDSLVKMYIFQEFVMNLDAGTSSCFFYKDADSDKIFASPAWDFDYSFVEQLIRFGVDIGDPNIWWANSLYYDPGIEYGVNQIPTIFTQVYKHEDFRALVSEKWAEISGAFDSEKISDTVDILKETMSASAVMDAYRWDKFANSSGYDGKLAAYCESTEVVKNFAAARQISLDKGFSSEGAMLYYDLNGAKGNVFNYEIAAVGETVTVRGIEGGGTVPVSPNGYPFAGWNTEKDGSGTSYAVGDSVTLNGKTTVLYAQWKVTEETKKCDHICHKGGIEGFFWKIINIFNKLFGINKVCECGIKHY
ncbi:MAG: CotH kinase family protein [Acutalibacteraceae bacterium]